MLVEAGPDKTWGVGLKLNHLKILDHTCWQEENLLQKIVMTIREELKLKVQMQTSFRRYQLLTKCYETAYTLGLKHY